MATQNIFSMVDTWNAGGTTFTAIKMDVLDTASAAGSLLLDLQVGGASKFKVNKAGGATFTDNITGASGKSIDSFSFYTTNSGTANGFYARSDTGAFGLGVSDDVMLRRDAANTLAQRNGTNAQAFRVYNTFTDASNFERIALYYDGSGTDRIWMERAGTGSARNLSIGGDAATLQFGVGATVRWQINSSGHLIAQADNTYDIGASGATRPRNIYFAGGLIGGYIQAAAGSGISWVGRSSLTSPSDSVITLTNAALSDFSRLQFGGTTSSFPSLKRGGAELQVRLADDTGDANLVAGQLKAAGGVTAGYGTAIPAGGNNGIGLKGTSTANFGVFFGSGAPTLSAAKGSLYLRSDGTTTNDRAYINTDGASTWTAVTTAA